MSKLILLNGPRHSGKDTGADYLVEAKGAFPFKFSGGIKRAIKAAFNLRERDVEYLESIKTEPTPLLFGKSYVQVQISFSEDWAKPFFGEDFFGYLATREILAQPVSGGKTPSLYVSSDSGFACEAWPVIRLFGEENVLLVQLFRDGKTFNGDSRDYIELDGITRVSLTNNGSIEDYHRNLGELADQWLQGTLSPDWSV